MPPATQAALWQAEGINHNVRSEEQLGRFRRHTAENLLKTRLR